jgi:hypothetical protein
MFRWLYPIIGSLLPVPLQLRPCRNLDRQWTPVSIQYSNGQRVKGTVNGVKTVYVDNYLEMSGGRTEEVFLRWLAAHRHAHR